MCNAFLSYSTGNMTLSISNQELQNFINIYRGRDLRLQLSETEVLSYFEITG